MWFLEFTFIHVCMHCCVVIDIRGWSIFLGRRVYGIRQCRVRTFRLVIKTSLQLKRRGHYFSSISKQRCRAFWGTGFSIPRPSYVLITSLWSFSRVNVHFHLQRIGGVSYMSDVLKLGYRKCFKNLNSLIRSLCVRVTFLSKVDFTILALIRIFITYSISSLTFWRNRDIKNVRPKPHPKVRKNSFFSKFPIHTEC